METTVGINMTELVDWLAGEGIRGYREIYNLYCSVREREDSAGFRVSTDGDRMTIHGEFAPLVLENDEARNAFLTAIDRWKKDCDLPMDGWYAFHRAMEKDD